MKKSCRYFSLISVLTRSDNGGSTFCSVLNMPQVIFRVFVCKFVSCRIPAIDWNYFIELPKLKTLTLIDEHGDLASDDSLKMAS